MKSKHSTSITILYEDSEIVAFNKPAGLVVNRAQTVSDKTLQDVVEQMYPETFLQNTQYNCSDDEKEQFFLRSGMVHRLDKDTSGVILWAKNPMMMFALMKLFKERQISKTYEALVHGRFQTASGSIQVPLGRMPKNRKKFGVVVGGKMTETEYEVLNEYDYRHPKYFHGLSLVRLRPKTGRTHQLRVVLKHLQHPIVGDHVYVGKKRSKTDKEIITRQFLHAKNIVFDHPTSGQSIQISAPYLSDLTEALDKLQIRES